MDLAKCRCGVVHRAEHAPCEEQGDGLRRNCVEVGSERNRARCAAVSATIRGCLETNLPRLLFRALPREYIRVYGHDIHSTAATCKPGPLDFEQIPEVASCASTKVDDASGRCAICLRHFRCANHELFLRSAQRGV